MVRSPLKLSLPNGIHIFSPFSHRMTNGRKLAKKYRAGADVFDNNATRERTYCERSLPLSSRRWRRGGIENFNWPCLDYRDYYLGRGERYRYRERERKKRAVHRVIPLCSSLWKSPRCRSTIPSNTYFTSSPNTVVRFLSRRSMAIHNATAYLSAKRGGGRGGVGRRKRERERISRDRRHDEKIIPPSREPWKRSWWWISSVLPWNFFIKRSTACKKQSSRRLLPLS